MIYSKPSHRSITYFCQDCVMDTSSRLLCEVALGRSSTVRQNYMLAERERTLRYHFYFLEYPEQCLLILLMHHESLWRKFSLEGISLQFYLESMSSMPATSKTQKAIHKTSWNNIFPPLRGVKERREKNTKRKKSHCQFCCQQSSDFKSGMNADGLQQGEAPCVGAVMNSRLNSEN